MPYSQTIETSGYRVFRDQDPEVVSGEEITTQGYKVIGYDENGVELIENVGDLAGAHYFRSAREQQLTTDRKNGSWAMGPVLCIMVENVGMVPVKNRQLEADGDYAGKFCEGSVDDFPSFATNPLDNIVSIDGKRPENGDIGFVVQMLNQKQEELVFIPVKKKNELEEIPLTVTATGPSEFITQSIEEPLSVLTSLEIDEEEQFFFTNLFRVKDLLVTHEENSGATLLSPKTLDDSGISIICRGGQNLAKIQASQCGGDLDNVFIYKPNLVSGRISDGEGGFTPVLVIHSDGFDDLLFSSDCCDEEEEEEPILDEEFPFILKYNDSLGITQFLVRDRFDNNFGPRYTSAAMFGNFFSDPSTDIHEQLVAEIQPKHSLPRVDLTIDGTSLNMVINYGTLEDEGEPNINGAVLDQMQSNQDEGIDAFGRLEIVTRKIVNREVGASDIPGSYIVFDGNGDPNPLNPGDPPNFVANIENFKFA